MTVTADVAVIGGGIHGCSAALHCALKGLSVAVVEKNTVARHASGVNAGGVRRLGRDLAEVPLSVAAMEIWHDIADLVDDDCGFHCAPQIEIAETEAELGQLAARVQAMRSRGFTHEELVDRAELRRLLPAAAAHCRGALVSRDDGCAEPYRTTVAFQRKAAALGARFLEEMRVTEVQRHGRTWRLETGGEAVEAPTLVNCGGAWAGEIAARLEEPVPIEAIAPMMIVTDRMPRFCDAVVGTAGRPLSFKQMGNGTVVIGGGRRGRADPAAERTDLVFSELAKTAQTAAEVFPVMRSARAVRCWAGIEGRMPDDLPVIGPSSTAPGVHHAFGFSAHGFQLGPIVGRVLAELIGTGETRYPIEPFRIDRFRSASASPVDAVQSTSGGR
jgi:sarcosine oxidase subunit beta